MKNTTFDRRTAIGGTAALAAGAALTACSGGSTDTAPAAGTTSGSSGAKATAIGSMPPSSAAPSVTDGAGALNALARTSDIAVGGGVIYADSKVVVTQPTAGEFKAFSAVCTHQGCLVGSIEGDSIVCPCHSSKFTITDGSVTAGPATAPLAPQPITVTGDEIKLGG